MTDDHKPGDEQSGYKRPPGSGRFKRGVSGNPRGRPKGSRNVRTDFQQEMNANVNVHANGKARRVSTQKAVLMRLKEMALQGDIRAITKTIDTAIKLEATAGSEDQAQEVLSDADKEIIADFLRDNMLEQVAEQGPATGPTEGDSAVLPHGDAGIRDSDKSSLDLVGHVPDRHPLRLIRRIVDGVLVALDAELKVYVTNQQPTIPPDRLLRALLLQAFYTIRSETELMEQLDYNLLYRWFVGIPGDEPVWAPTKFTKNLDRLLDAEVADRFLVDLLNKTEVQCLLSDKHFSVDTVAITVWRGALGSSQPNAGSSDDLMPQTTPISANAR